MFSKTRLVFSAPLGLGSPSILRASQRSHSTENMFYNSNKETSQFKVFLVTLPSVYGGEK